MIIPHTYLLLYRIKYPLILELEDRSSRPALPLPAVAPRAGASLALSLLPVKWGQWQSLPCQVIVSEDMMTQWL